MTLAESSDSERRRHPPFARRGASGAFVEQGTEIKRPVPPRLRLVSITDDDMVTGHDAQDAAEAFSRVVHILLLATVFSAGLAMILGVIGYLDGTALLRVISAGLFIVAACCAALWIERADHERNRAT